jgi:hypothetical protein
MKAFVTGLLYDSGYVIPAPAQRVMDGLHFGIVGSSTASFAKHLRLASCWQIYFLHSRRRRSTSSRFLDDDWLLRKKATFFRKLHVHAVYMTISVRTAR